MGLLTDLASAATAIYGFDQGIEDVRDVGTDALNLAQTLGDDAASRSRFKPFAISSSGGSGGVSSADGVTSLNLTPQAQAIQDQLRTQGASLFGNVTGSTADREQANFDKLEAMLNPARERDRLALEERLFRQGRTGVTTSMFGGTPEALALNKAIEESRSENAVKAIDLARQEQAQNAQLGQTLFGASFAPENQLLKLLQGGTGLADVASTADRQGAQLFAGLAEQGLESKIQAEAVAGNLRQQQIDAIATLLTGSGDGANATQGLIDQILGLFS